MHLHARVADVRLTEVLLVWYAWVIPLAYLFGICTYLGT